MSDYQEPCGYPVLDCALGVYVTKCEDRIEQLVAINEELEAERDASLVALFECMEEIDAYIQQEYPQDHPVHERYRQRDYSANPARIFLRYRPDAALKARATLAELSGVSCANLKGEKDE